MTRLEENIGGGALTLRAEELATIKQALDGINLQGERYPAILAGLQGR
jgi:hypothetical protein